MNEIHILYAFSDLSMRLFVNHTLNVNGIWKTWQKTQFIKQENEKYPETKTQIIHINQPHQHKNTYSLTYSQLAMLIYEGEEPLRAE